MKRTLFLAIAICLSYFSVCQVPIISGFTPKSAAPGDLDTIFGSNFHPLAANNLVQYGTAKADVVFASTNMLVVSLPYGAKHDYISVIRRTDSLIAYSFSKFLPTFNSPTFGFFKPSIASNVRNQSQIAIGDLNLDGKPDLVTIDSSGNTFRVYQNYNLPGQLNPDSFKLAVIFPNSSSAPFNQIKLADLNGDGKPEILVNSHSGTPSNFRIFRNAVTTGGNISQVNFSATTVYSNTNYTIESFDVNDLNSDGKADIALVTQEGLVVLRNNWVTQNLALNSFIASATIINTTTFGNERGVRIADLDNDGKNDIVFTNSNNSTLNILKNNGLPFSTMTASDFSSMITISTSPSKVNTLEISDLDLDGKLDIVSNSSVVGVVDRVLIYRNISVPGTLNAASFASKLEITGCSNYHRVKVEDINGDRRPDIILTNGRLLGSVQILENKLVNNVLDACTFQRSLQVSTNDRASFAGMDICDINMDGIPDMVSVKMADSLMYFFEGTTIYKPTIKSVNPNNGFPGDTININGSNFFTNPTLTKVFFEHSQANIISITSSQIKVVVPASATAGFIHVTVNSKTIFSPLKFIPKIKSEGGAFYRQKVDINLTGKYPIKILSADLDNDQKPEILVLNRDSNFISIFRNIGTGGAITASSFAPPFSITTSSTPDELVIADLDMDGKKDLLVNYSSGSTYSIIRNNYVSGTLSQASFSSRLDLGGLLPALYETKNMIVSDIDLDGRSDIINLAPNQIYAILNLGSAGFIDSTSFNTKGVSTSPASSLTFRNFDVGDLDGDGKPELLVSYTTCGRISIIKNALSSINDISSFLLKDISSNGIIQSFDIPFACAESVRIADMNGDGKNDIVVFNFNDDSITVFKNISTNGCFGSSSFQRFDKSLIASNSGSRYLCDINGDGKPDIISEAYSTVGNELISAIINRSTANQFDFLSQNIVNASQNAISSCVIDLNGDSIPDFITANYNWPTINSISIFQGEAISKIPVITDFSPAKAAPGMVDTIFGNFFSSVFSENLVNFGAVRATVISASKNIIVVRIPAGASYDRISISVNGSTVYSSKKFLPIYSDTGSTFSATSFSITPQSNTTASGTINSIAFDDVDMDGKPDLMATNSSDVLHVFKNNNNAFNPISVTTLSASTAFNGTSQVDLMDMNGDGKRDIVALTNSSSSIRVLRNTASTNLINSSSFSLATLSFPNTATKSIGDVDGDGRPDLIIRNTSNSMITYRNSNLNAGGNITFDSKPLSTRALGSPIYLKGGIIQADLDGDNLSEAIVGRSNNIAVYRYNNRPGAFTPYTNGFATLQTDTTPDIILYGDLDNDTRNDVLVVHRSSRSFSFVKNLFNGVTFNNTTFGSKISLSASVNLTPSAADIGDIDGDGRPDLAIGFTNGSVSFFRNISQTGILNSASFATGVNITTSLTALNSLKIQDINGDGIPEITLGGAAGSTNAKVQIVSFNSVIAPPTIQAASLVFTNTIANSMRLNWTNGNGARRLVIASLSPITVNPTNNRFYQANAQFYLGDTVATAGNFVVYNGIGDNFVINGLNPFTTYYFKIVEYNGNGISSKYLSGANLFGSNTTLPVTLLNFSVTGCNEKCADLKWQTSSEINNHYFDVERSINTMDWTVIGRIKGAGNSNSMLSYGMIDYMTNMSLPLPEKLFYRLKQVDFDGQFSLSNIELLNLDQNTQQVLIFPNPFENELRIICKNCELSHVSIYDLQGTLIYSGNKFLDEKINLSNLPAGIYLVKISNSIGETLQFEKVFKL